MVMSKTNAHQAIQPNEDVANIESVVDASQVEQILNSLPSDQKAILLSAMRQESFSGPLPPPQYYEGYEKVLPGSADRILTMTELQVNHRIKQEGHIVRRTLNQKLLGVIFGGFLTILILGAVVYLGMNGHDTLAGIIGTTTILGVITVFVLGVKPNSEKEEKRY